MLQTGLLSASVGWSLDSLPCWLALSGGLPERYRIPFVVVFAIGSIGGLALLAYKIRSSDPEPTNEREISSTLRRENLLEGGDPANTLEWIIKVANKPSSYALLFVLLTALGVLTMTTDAGDAIGPILVFGAILVLMQAFLRYGWQYIDAFHERRQSDERDPESLRFQGFSTDVMTFLTLLAAFFAGLMLLVALEIRLS